MAPDFDLQSHSAHSDGELAPADVVAAAGAAGIRLLALSDHDTVDGVQEALEAGARHGVEIVPAVEISTVDGDHGDLHVLGYRIDHRDPTLLEALERARGERSARAERMADALRAVGIEVDDEPLEARRAAGLSIGRPHLAHAALGHLANADRLAEEGATDVGRFIERYLIPGRSGFVERRAPSVQDAADLIHGAGGVAVWAHPYWDLESEDEVDAAVARFATMGLDGVEAFYITHTRGQTEHAVSAAERHDLLTTGSADFHGPSHPQFHGFGVFDLFGLTPRLGPIDRGAAGR